MITLSLINGNAHCFNADDYMKIRTEYRVIGNLVGIPATHPRNLNWSGLPVIFNEYELKLMIDKQFVTVFNKSGLKETPTEENKRLYENIRVTQIAEQQEPYIKKRLDIIKRNVSKIVAGKRKKLMKSGVPETEITITEEDVLKDEEARLREGISDNNFTQIPTQHPFQVKQEEITEIEVSNIKKYQIYADLWTQGGFISNGESFGCDFLQYPGDPLYYHASHIIHIIDYQQSFDIKYLISAVRLSVTVNKQCVFAYENDQQELKYQTLSWEGNAKYSDDPVNNDEMEL
ncbi:unnamed protein product [Diamesa hyperborea]